MDTFVLENFEIYVDVYEQRKLQEQFKNFNLQMGAVSLPTYPLNTDGIDPSGSNIIIRNLTITCHDDAVAVKPMHQGGTLAKCAENITVENVLVYFGVGMTIGTVPPHNLHNCVRNVTFRNITFKNPYKAVYVKSNPGNSGTGMIENIVYDGLKIENPLWWGIYIGPQQQKQPDGGGPGCMLYPLLKHCDTEARVTMRNITVKNVHMTGGIVPPGIIRCNATNPCTGFHFENVYATGWFTPLNIGYITENVVGTASYVWPDPGFNNTLSTTSDEELAKIVAHMTSKDWAQGTHSYFKTLE